MHIIYTMLCEDPHNLTSQLQNVCIRYVIYAGLLNRFPWGNITHHTRQNLHAVPGTYLLNKTDTLYRICNRNSEKFNRVAKCFRSQTLVYKSRSSQYLGIQKIYYCICQIPSWVSTLSWINSVHNVSCSYRCLLKYSPIFTHV